MPHRSLRTHLSVVMSLIGFDELDLSGGVSQSARPAAANGVAATSAGKNLHDDLFAPSFAAMPSAAVAAAAPAAAAAAAAAASPFGDAPIAPFVAATSAKTTTAAAAVVSNPFANGATHARYLSVIIIVGVQFALTKRGDRRGSSGGPSQGGAVARQGDSSRLGRAAAALRGGAIALST